MLFAVVTLITLAITFLLNPISKKVSKKIKGDRHPKWHIHHSVTGLAILAVGLLVGVKIISAIVLGIYLGHVAEEIYFNKRNPIRALFILVSRAK
ncbi:MAG TPA: hypothetical protein VF401_03360 [Candidatus Saccharimonadales bacterium]